MGKKNLKKYAPAFKARVAIEAEHESLAQLGQRHGVHPVLVGQWKKKLLERAAEAFTTEGASQDIEQRHDETSCSRRSELLQLSGEVLTGLVGFVLEHRAAEVPVQLDVASRWTPALRRLPRLAESMLQPLEHVQHPGQRLAREVARHLDAECADAHHRRLPHRRLVGHHHDSRQPHSASPFQASGEVSPGKGPDRNYLANFRGFTS